MNYRYYILPGGDGRNDYGWFNWLKKELEDRGHEATICEEYIMSPAKRAEVFLTKYPLDERTIIVGHSFGALAAIKWVEYSTRYIHGLILVDPSIKDAFETPWEQDEEMRVSFLESWDWQMDLSLVRSRIAMCTILSDEQLAAKRKNWESKQRAMVEQLGAQFILLKAQKQHFCAEQEPSILAAAIELSGETEKT